MLTNKSAVKRMALDLSRSTRGGKFTQVSKEFVDECERFLRQHIVNMVHRHPSKGKTLYPS